MVKVKILKNINNWKIGDVVEVSKDMAKHLCHVNNLSDGISEDKRVRAILLEEAEEQEAADKEISNLTAGEAAKLGIKNIVDSAPMKEEMEANQKIVDEGKKKIKEEEKAAKKKAQQG